MAMIGVLVNHKNERRWNLYTIELNIVLVDIGGLIKIKNRRILE